MHGTAIILIGLVFFTFAFSRRSPSRTKPAWGDYLKGWQKIFGLIAVLLVVLILINPDLLALGLLGDATFFDMLVLILSLQMLFYVQETWRICSKVIVKGLRLFGIPSLGMRSLLSVSAVAIGSVISSIQKLMHRILS